MRGAAVSPLVSLVFERFELVDKTYPKTLSIISEHRRKCDRAEQTEEGARDAQSRLEGPAKSRVTGKHQAPTDMASWESEVVGLRCLRQLFWSKTHVRRRVSKAQVRAADPNTDLRPS